MAKFLMRSDVLSGLLMIVLGVFTISQSLGYNFGTLRRMGPGFFPIVLSVGLCLIGIAMIVSKAFVPKGADVDVDNLNMRGIVGVLGGLLALALLLEPFGLIPAIFAGVLIASLADRQLKLVPALVLALVLSAFCYSVFVWALNLPLKAFGA